MSISPKQECIEEFLRKSLLGEELINTQFHLFSSRSLSSGLVVDPRVLCANNVLLAKNSKYFLDLLSSDTNPSDASLLDLTDENDVPNNLRIDDYGYESDSDLDECNDPVVNTGKSKDRSATTPIKTSGANRSKDEDELSDDGSESVSSDMFVMSPEQPRPDEPFPVDKDGSVASSETAVQGPGTNKTGNRTALRLRFLGSRHILVKDAAFQTWYSLLNYLYTDNFSFLPLTSTPPSGQPHESSTSSLDDPKCSAKSMYRLACKVGLDDLRDEAFFYIKDNLTEHNILKELSCSLVSKHAELLEMELDVLYSYIATPPVVAGFPDLARRIANKELLHGADVLVGIHTRILKPQPVLFSGASRPPPESSVTGLDDIDEDEEEIISPRTVEPPPAPRATGSSSFTGAPSPKAAAPSQTPKPASALQTLLSRTSASPQVPRDYGRSRKGN